MTAAYFQRLARYNAWANARLYDGAASLEEAACRLDRGAFFGSLHNTLNHILVADRIWMHRFTGTGETYTQLDTVPCGDLSSLRAAREAEDARIERWVGGLTDDGIAATFTYANMAGEPQAWPQGLVLAHFFNHQTHHRGQAHAMLSQAGRKPPQLDLIYFLPEDCRS